MKILYFGIYITKDEINPISKKVFNLSLSDASRLVFKPVGDLAVVAFNLATFVDIDPEKLWSNIHNIVQTKYPNYDSVSVTIYIDQFLKFDKDMQNYLDSISSLFDDLSDYYMMFDRETSEQHIDLHQSEAFKALQEKKKEPKLPKIPKIQSSYKSKVWDLFTADQRKTMFGHRGYLITDNEKAVKKDIDSIQKFLDEFIPDNSSFGKKFKKELVSRWVAVYVKYVE